jgi:thymidylate synthase (FAD)
MKADLLVNTQDDLMIANVARTSFNKWNDRLDLTLNDKGKPKDPSLIDYLAKHEHISPFFHIRFTFRFSLNDFDLYSVYDPTLLMGLVYKKELNDIVVRTSFYGWMRLVKEPLVLSFEAKRRVEATLAIYAPHAHDAYFSTPHKLEDFSIEYDNPLFQDASFRITDALPVVRQMFTHRMFATNEVSRRYVSTEPEIHYHKQWRLKPDGSIKQGSGRLADAKLQVIADSIYQTSMTAGVNGYNALIGLGLAPEQVRYLLPQAMKTDVVFTGSIQAWKDVISKRTYSGAQQEIRDLAYSIESQLFKE